MFGKDEHFQFYCGFSAGAACCGKVIAVLPDRFEMSDMQLHFADMHFCCLGKEHFQFLLKKSSLLSQRTLKDSFHFLTEGKGNTPLDFNRSWVYAQTRADE